MVQVMQGAWCVMKHIVHVARVSTVLRFPMFTVCWQYVAAGTDSSRRLAKAQLCLVLAWRGGAVRFGGSHHVRHLPLTENVIVYT